MNNLHVSYDLNRPGQNYEAVIKAIKSLGAAVPVHKSFWFVKSSLSAEQAAQRVWASMDASDTVYVVDASSNQAAWYNINPTVAKFIRDYWMRKAA